MFKTCPRCRTNLQPKAFEGRLKDPAHGNALEVTMDACGGCGGFWFDRLEAEATIGLREEIKELESFAVTQPYCGSCDRMYASGTALCPRCSERLVVACPCCDVVMTHVFILGVRLDLCVACEGIWFDGGELRALNAQLKAQGVRLGGDAPYAICSACGRRGLERARSCYSDSGLVCDSCAMDDRWAGTHQAAALERSRSGEIRRRRERQADVGDVLSLLMK